MSKSERPHETKMILEFSDSGSNIIFRRCSKTGQGHCDHAHLSAFSLRRVEFYEEWVMMLQFAVLQSARSDIARGAKIKPQPWMGKQKTRAALRGLYDRTSPKRKDHEEGMKTFKRIFKRYVLRNQFFKGWKWQFKCYIKMRWILQGQSRLAISYLRLNASEKCDIIIVHVILHEECLFPLIRLLFKPHWALFCLLTFHKFLDANISCHFCQNLRPAIRAQVMLMSWSKSCFLRFGCLRCCIVVADIEYRPALSLFYFSYRWLLIVNPHKVLLDFRFYISFSVRLVHYAAWIFDNCFRYFELYIKGVFSNG